MNPPFVWADFYFKIDGSISGLFNKSVDTKPRPFYISAGNKI